MTRKKVKKHQKRWKMQKPKGGLTERHKQETGRYLPGRKGNKEAVPSTGWA